MPKPSSGSARRASNELTRLSKRGANTAASAARFRSTRSPLKPADRAPKTKSIRRTGRK